MVAWSSLGATLGPLLLVRLSGRPLPPWLALTMMGAGLVSVIAWRATPWADAVYEALPGVLVPLLIYTIGSRVGALGRAK